MSFVFCGQLSPFIPAMHVYKERKQDIQDLAEYCGSDTSNIVFRFRKGNSPAEILKEARKSYYRNGSFKTLLKIESNTAYNQTITAPFLQRAIYGDELARSFYESFRDLSIVRLKPWLRDSAESFATEKLNEKSWDSLFDENLIKTILNSFRITKVDPPKGIDVSNKTSVGNLIKNFFTKYPSLAWLGLFKFSSHWRYNRFISLCAQRAAIKDDFQSRYYELRSVAKIAFYKTAPKYTNTSIFHPGNRADFLRKVGKETSDFILAGQIIEDICNLWELSFDDAQKLSLAKYCWKDPWQLTSHRFAKRMELTLIFIDQHAEQFRSQKEQSDFLLEALTCESLTATLEDKQQNLNKRKARTNNGTSEFGKNSSMKQFFNLAAQTLETTLPELNISGKDLYYWWRISSDSASNQLCEILLITDKKTLKESLLEWQKTNITDRKPLSSKAAEENSENPLTQPTTSTYSENIILIDEYNGAKTPFNSSFEKICKTASSEVINAILDRLTRLRQGHWGDFKHIESMKGVRELRIHQDQGWRIYLYKTEDNKFLLLDVCPKCDQVRDIERLRALKYSD